MLENNYHSPYGNGWRPGNIQRIYATGSGDIMLSEEGGGNVLFEGGNKVETVVGTGADGYSGEGLPADQSRLDNPVDIAFHPVTGELYISDKDNGRVRKVGADGTLITVAGGGSDATSEGIPATEARFDGPNSSLGMIGFDPAGNLYLVAVRYQYSIIRRVGTDGLIRTVYRASAPALSEVIFDVAGDAGGNVWWTDRGRGLIRKMDTAGNITDVLGGGTGVLYGDRPLGAGIALRGPTGLFINEKGEVFFSSGTAIVKSGIFKIDTSQVIRRIAGGGGSKGEDVQARQAGEVYAMSITEDREGNVYYSAGSIMKVDVGGMLRRYAGRETIETVDAPTTPAELSGPALGARIVAGGVALSPTGEVYFADIYTNVIRRVVPYGEDEAREFVPPLGEFSRLFKNTDGTYTRIYKTGRRVTFNAEGLETASEDRGGNITSYEYDSLGKLIRITDPVGLVTVLAYDGERLSSVTDPAGRTTQFELDGAGNLIRVASPGGDAVQYTYDTSNRMISKVDSGGRSVGYVYSENGEVKEVHRPTGEVVKLQAYFTAGVVANPGDALNPATVVEATPHQVTDGRGGTSATYWYDPSPIHYMMREKEMLITFDALSQASGQFKVVFRNAAHMPLLIMDTSFWAVSFEYDAKGNIISMTRGGFGYNHTMSYTYDLVFNQPMSVTDANGNTTHFEYNEKGGLVRIKDPLNHYTSATRNEMGLVTSITDELNQTTAFTYDSMWNLATVRDPMGNTTVFSYDAAGNVTAVTDPEGNTTAFTYDPANRLTGVRKADGATTTYSYALNGCGCVNGDLITSVTDPNGNTTTYEYDTVGNLVAIRGAAGDIETRGYDLNRNLTSILDRNGNLIRFNYDAINQLTEIIKPEEVVALYYNGHGMVTTASNAATEIAMSYISGDRLQSVWAGHQPDAEIFYTRDNAGDVTTTSLFGTAIQTPRDAMGRVREVSSSGDLFTIAYDAAGRRTSSYNNQTAVSTIAQYDPASRLTGLRNVAGANVLSQYDYTYDRAGNRITTQDQAGTHNYTYDSAYRLLGVSDPMEGFSYDMGGNILSSTGPSGQPLTYTYNALNQLTAITKDGAEYASFTYDGNGNMLTKVMGGVTTTYTWDSQNRLVGAQTPTNTVEFAYDPFGKRIEKIVDGDVTRYLYDREDVVAEFDGNGTMKAMYIHGPGTDEPLAEVVGSSTYYYQRNGLGSVTSMTDASGNKVKTYQYDSYGNITNQTGTIENPYAFTGREYDAETGLYYYRARYYDPTIGRFISADPIGFAGGPNFYAYVDGNPVSWVDPEGEGYIVAGIAIAVGGYTIYKIIDLWGNFIEKSEQLEKATQEYYNDPLNADKFYEKEKAYNDACRAGVRAGAVIPGTSLTGPIPLTPSSVISHGVQGYMIENVLRD